MKKVLTLALLLVAMLVANAQVIYIEITPDQVTLAPGQSQRFTAIGFDKRHEQVPFRPIWVVEGKGRITPDGYYTAANNVDDMDFVKAINPITKAQQSARVLIRVPKVEKPVMPPVHVHPVKPVTPVPPVHVHPVKPVTPVKPVQVTPVKPAPMPTVPPVHRPIH